VTLSLPIFPLAGPALFPHCAAPLHIFEPRYRAMVADAIAGERRIGMVTVRGEAPAEMAGDPAVYSIGCAGFIAEHQRLADGRYLIILQATSRFRIVSEAPRPADRLYRVAQVEWISDEAGDAARALAHRDEVVRELRVLAGGVGAEGGLDLARIEQLELGRFAGEVCQALRLPGPEKQALLEASTIEQRLERLEQTLGFYRTLSEAPGRGGSTVH
jgi:Lon protease-like protein